MKHIYTIASRQDSQSHQLPVLDLLQIAPQKTEIHRNTPMSHFDMMSSSIRKIVHEQIHAVEQVQAFQPSQANPKALKTLPRKGTGKNLVGS